jgi:glycosyltransferase involved in cell wall biosynthesis
MDLYVVTNGWFSSKDIGGGYNIFMNMIKRWCKMGINLHIYTSWVGYLLIHGRSNIEADYHIIDKGPEVNELSTKRFILTSLKRIIKSCILLLDLQKKTSDIIILSYGDFIFDTFPCFFVKLFNKRIKWVSPFFMIAPSPFKGYRKAFSKEYKFPNLNEMLYFVNQRISTQLIKSCADLVLPIHPQIIKFLKKKGIPEKKICRINGGVDLKYLSKIKSKGKKYDACFVGRFHPQKGIDDLIDIWKIVCNSKNDAKLVMMGSGTQKMKEEIERLGLEKNIILMGFVNEVKKIKTIKESNIFLFPSYYESWGIVACEAMACGLPVIAYDLPVFKSIFKKGMVTAPLGKKQIFADKVIRLLDNENIRNKLSKCALETARLYDYDKTASVAFNALNKLVKKNN